MASDLDKVQRNLALLTINNSKLTKGTKHNYLTAGLHLSPHTISGYQVCPFATPACSADCLDRSGHGHRLKVQQARTRKTIFFHKERRSFLDALHADIWLIKEAAERLEMIPAFRLNLTSDIRWEQYGVPQQWPTLQFYDYTKWPRNRFPPPNYHLLFSFSGENLDDCRRMLANGINVAVPFKVRPAYWLGYPTIDGDEDDLRFMDGGPYVVGLSPKGRLKSHPDSPFFGDNANV